MPYNHVPKIIQIKNKIIYLRPNHLSGFQWGKFSSIISAEIHLHFEETFFIHHDVISIQVMTFQQLYLWIHLNQDLAREKEFAFPATTTERVLEPQSAEAEAIVLASTF